MNGKALRRRSHALTVVPGGIRNSWREEVVDEPIGSVVFVLHSHLPWVLGHGQWPHGEAWLHEAAAECYIPFLRMMDRIAVDEAHARITVGLTPVLCDSLASPRFREGFLEYLGNRRGLAERDVSHFRAAGDARSERLASAWSDFYAGTEEAFLGPYGGNLVGGFRRLQESGHVELITSAATHGYLPLLGRDESVAAQIRAGVASYRRHIGRSPGGIWLPECAYRPRGPWSRPTGSSRSWMRPGLEEFLAREGLRYFFVDTHLLTGGVPLGTYEDRFADRRLDATRPASGLSPYDVHALAGGSASDRVAVFARDPRSSVQVWSADYGYPGDGAYLEFHRKKEQGGLRYWRITDRRLPLDAKIAYDPKEAEERVQAHASHFCGLVRETLREHRRATGRAGVIVAPFDTELFGHWWFEGLRWLEAVLRNLAGDGSTTTASEALTLHPPRSTVTLPEGSWGQGGHHWVWWNDDTRWVWDLVYRAEDAFLEAVGSAPAREDAQRVLRQLARELLLLEASDWPFLITTFSARDYAEARMRTHMEAFEGLLSLLRRTAAGSLAARDDSTLAELEARDSLFPDIDLGWWRGVAAP
jgi:1,4-alpha-glucan branching enzyme